jgi:hypothetical protein
MKPLNRPMFRYGGPIKEGVMSGIREPKKNGGSMANNEGPSRVALVGNPIYPKGPDGRTNHVVPFFNRCSKCSSKNFTSSLQRL